MLGVCPHCGQPLPEGSDGLETLRQLAEDLGIVIDADGTVSAMDAARLLGRAKAAFYLEAGRLHWLNEGAAG